MRWRFAAVILALLFVFQPWPTEAAPNDSFSIASAWYAQYNHDYFNNKLDTDVIIYKIHDDRFAGLTESSGHRIGLNPKYTVDGNFMKIVLLHEMCHAATWDDAEPDAHGSKWHHCINTLIEKGAYEGLM